MARTSPTLRLPAPAPGSRRARKALSACFFAVVCGVASAMVALAAAMLTGLLASLSSASDAVPELLALHAESATGGLVGSAVAALMQLLALALLISAAGAVLMLLTGAGLAFAQPGRQRAAVRIATTGLRMTLLVVLGAFLPLARHPSNGAGLWHPALQWLAAAACLGLLLSAIVRRPHAARLGDSRQFGDTTDG